MSQYATLDTAIVTRLSEVPHINTDFTGLHFSPAIKQEVARIAAATRRDEFRVLDGRLQALRKKGTIAYSTTRGWQLTAAPVI